MLRWFELAGPNRGNERRTAPGAARGAAQGAARWTAAREEKVERGDLNSCYHPCIFNARAAKRQVCFVHVSMQSESVISCGFTIRVYSTQRGVVHTVTV